MKVKLKILTLRSFNEALGPIINDSSSSTSTSTDRRGRLREVRIDNVGHFNSMPMSMCMDSFHHLSKVTIITDGENRVVNNSGGVPKWLFVLD